MPYLNIYALDRHYGGPEEGGWYYDSGAPVASLTLPEGTSDEAADALVDALREVYDYRGRVGSVLYPDRGHDYSVVLEDAPAEAWPAETPRYE